MKPMEAMIAALFMALVLGVLFTLVERSARADERRRMYKQIKLECLQEITKEAARRSVPEMADEGGD